MHSCLFNSKNYYNYTGKYEKLLFLAKYANYLIKYAQYKNGPSKNQFYGKKLV